MPRLAPLSVALIALVGLVLGACSSAPSQAPIILRVAAADSFGPALRDLAQDYHARQPWVRVEFHFANTAKLEQLIKDSKPFDLIIPARTETITSLIQHNVLSPRSLSPLPIAVNQLVLIARPDTNLPADPKSLVSPTVLQIAVSNPSNHFLGYLTNQSLTSLRLLPRHEAQPLVQTPPAADVANLEPKLLVLENEAEIFDAVKNGRAQIGITYNTYALLDKDVRILCPLPLRTYQPLAFNPAIPRSAPNAEEAWNFLNYIKSPQGRGMLQRAGLIVNF